MKLFHLKDYCRPGLPLWIDFQSYSARHEEEHLHDCREIVFVIEGNGVEIVSGNRFPIISGDLYLMHESDSHSFSTTGKLSFYNLMFSNELFSADELAAFENIPAYRRAFGPDPDTRLRHKYSIHPPLSEKLAAILQHLQSELYSGGEGSRLIAKALFIQFLVTILRYLSVSRAETPSDDNERLNSISRIISHIHKHYQRRISNGELARAGNVSPSYLGELFKKHTGSNPSDYIAKLRIDKARDAIDNNSNSLSELALDLGFHDSSHFSRTFKRHTGLSPREYLRLRNPSR